MGVERVNKPGNHVWLKTLGNAPYRKGVFGCVLGFVFGCSRGIKGFCVDPGKSRDSVGVDFSVSRPPSGSPRRL